MRGLNLKEIMSKSNMNQQGLNIATYGQAYSTWIWKYLVELIRQSDGRIRLN